MSRDLMFQDEILAAVRRAYRAIPAGAGRAMAERFYSDEELAALPSEALEWSLGVHDPVRHAGLAPGETVLDIGCVGGIDTVLAARAVGPAGHVVGLDVLPSEEVFTTKLGNVGLVDVEMSDRVPFGIDDVALYPLLTADTIERMRELIPPRRHDAVCVGVILRATKPGDGRPTP